MSGELFKKKLSTSDIIVSGPENQCDISFIKNISSRLYH